MAEYNDPQIVKTVLAPRTLPTVYIQGDVLIFKIKPYWPRVQATKVSDGEWGFLLMDEHEDIVHDTGSMPSTRAALWGRILTYAAAYCEGK